MSRRRCTLKHFISFIGFLVLIISSGGVYGQDIYDNAPPDMKWHQLNTPHFKIIFPENYEKNAQEVANRLEQIYLPASKSLDASPRKIPIILQNRNTVSNGFVTLSPRRSEFFTMPPQDYNFLGTNTWMDLLSVHEYRHIVQFQQSKTGWNKLFYYLFGQNALAGMAHVAAPRWFWEGDATLTETLYTPSGRGRIPAFNRVYRANLLEGKDYKYIKQHLRSYKDFIPNHYVLGYHYATHIRRRTNDPEMWDKVTEDAYSWSFIPFTFSNSLKKNTGYNIRQNYRLMQEELKNVWKQQQVVLSPEDYEPVIREGKIFTNYNYPQLLSDSTVVVLKNGIGDVDHFVRLNEDGEEIDSYIPGMFNEAAMLSAAGTKVVWNEIFADVRWRKENSSVIKIYDFDTKKRNTLTRNTRYSGASFSPDASEIVTSLTTTDQQHYLVVIDAANGQEIKRFSTPDNSFLSMARFSDDGKRIVSLTNNEEGKGIVAFDYITGEIENLFPPGRENLGHPVLYENYLFYNSPWNGIDNIYALDLSENKKYRVTNSMYGAYNPEIDAAAKRIIFNDHKKMGMNISSVPFDESLWVPLEKVSVAKADYFEPLLEQESIEGLNKNEEITYETKRYRSITHILNIHSWGPIATSDLNTAQLAIFSDDILKTTGITAGYEYDINDRSGYYFADISYQGLFPIFDLRLEKGDRSTSRFINGREAEMTWSETTTEMGVRLPFNLTRSKFFSQLELGYNIGVRRINNFDNSLEIRKNPYLTDRAVPLSDSVAYFFQGEVEGGTLAFDNINLSYYLLQKQSPRDLNSRWGGVVNLEGYNTRNFFSNDFTGSLYALRSTFYFPSPLYLINKKLAKHHSVYIRFSGQKRSSELSQNLYFFRNRIFMPRGYSYPSYEEFISLSFNYKLPLFYPDWNIGPLLYIKRVKLNTFYDWGRGAGREFLILFKPSPSQIGYYPIEKNYSSVGAELTFDINVMRFPADIDLGVRWVYALDTKLSTFDFLLLNIDF